MSHDTHHPHDHVHGAGCGHMALIHDSHVDYLHDGHLHHHHNDHYDEHSLDASGMNPDVCTSGHSCSGHPANHSHGPGCGHPAVPHAGHTDYLVDGHLHHPHNGHCDHHGPVQFA